MLSREICRHVGVGEWDLPSGEFAHVDKEKVRELARSAIQRSELDRRQFISHVLLRPDRHPLLLLLSWNHRAMGTTVCNIVYAVRPAAGNARHLSSAVPQP